MGIHLKNLFTVVFFFFFSLVVHSQDLRTGSQIVTYSQFDQRPPFSKLDSFFNTISNSIFINFGDGFDDSVYLYRNDTCIAKEYFKTDESTGEVFYNTGFSFKALDDTIFFTI